ncbi:MAG TPA: N-acetylmuramoyl-L-alanine amidase [Chitinophagaceae bacterium]|nr:N-acetylmuramoyl-L-alanine amidase [Chitinophagaceae bacterium]
MKSLLFYLIAVTCISAILYGYYYLALRNKKFHRYNRFYLLAATVLSLSIPFFNIPFYLSESEGQSSFVLKTLAVISGTGHEEEAIIGKSGDFGSTGWLTAQNLLYAGYAILAFIFLLRIAISLINLRRIVKKNPHEKIDRIYFINTEEPGTPYSFFRWLFWNKKIELLSEKGEQIFRHELFHIKQKHSLDVIFLELVTVVFWINPFFHLIKKELKAIHEFLADRFAVTENNKWQYAELLLMQALQTNQSLVNPFFHNQIKRRIAMITTSQKPGHQYFRKLMLLPLVAIALTLFAFNYKNKKEADPKNPHNKSFTVVIDAGHGGQDAGATANDGTLEKDIVLSIAQKIKSLNEDKNIQIILSRETDTYPELKSRIDLAKSSNADLFISLHINSANPSLQKQEEKKGIEASISGKNKIFEPENKILASIFLNYFSRLYSTKMEIIKREKGIYVLDNAPCPSILIECGYLTNQQDLDYLKKLSNQEALAKSVLQSIDQYIMQTKGDDWSERKRIVSDTTKPQIKAITESSTGTKYLTVNGKKVTGILVGNDGKGYGLIMKDEMLVLNNEAFMKVRNEHPDLVKKLFQEEVATKDSRNTIIFAKAEVEPQFPGGPEKWRDYLQRTINPLLPVDSGAAPGKYTVFIQFIVDKNGKTSNFKPLTKHGYGMEQEVVRILKAGPDWIPAMQNGKKVNAYVKQPVTFEITDETDDSSDQEGVIDKKGVEPQFPGGKEKYNQFLQSNINSEIPLENGAPNGTYTVALIFTVSKNGVVSDVKPMTKHGYGMEEEAIRVIKTGPNWIPAVYDGETVAAYKRLGMTFQITKNGSAIGRQ